MSPRDIRSTYGETLVELALSDPEIVVLVADSMLSSRVSAFQERFPDRFFDVGIAEQNLVGVCAGLAGSGKTVFASGIASFLVVRALEQIRTLVCHPQLNVKFAGMQAGLAIPHLGASHVMLEDLSLLRAIPNLAILYPADDAEANAAVRVAASYSGPVYLRFGAHPARPLPSSQEYRLGKAEILREGGRLALISAGPMAYDCLEAAQLLARDGISTGVVNLRTVKPMDDDLVLRVASRVEAVMTVEEHSIIGGIGGAVCELLSGKTGCPVKRLGIPDEFCIPGPRETLLERYHLTPEGIRTTALKFLGDLGPGKGVPG